MACGITIFPTLFEANQLSSPFFHLVNARPLDASGARDVRSYETQSVVDERIMALLGVRYLLSDKLLPDRQPVLQYRLVECRELYVYSIPAANLSGYAVRQTRRVANAQEAILSLADTSLDPRAVAVLTTAEELPPLVPVLTSSLFVERGGYRIQATSSGTSLIVLPIEYSHCLRARLMGVEGVPPPRLLRANLVMAAVLFTERMQGRLILRYGPMSSGWIEDWRDADAIGIGDPREWPAAR
jgi:hypothetical protein